jgi:hypothetical protein
MSSGAAKRDAESSMIQQLMHALFRIDDEVSTLLRSKTKYQNCFVFCAGKDETSGQVLGSVDILSLGR